MSSRLFCVLCLLSVYLFGCSASEPPSNPYNCPTASGYTLPDYCKPGGDVLSTESVGQSWFKPYVYYMYSLNPTTMACDDVDAISGCSMPQMYLFQPPSPAYNFSDITASYLSIRGDVDTICCGDSTKPCSFASYTNLLNDVTAVCSNPPTNTLQFMCDSQSLFKKDLGTICSIDPTKDELTTSYLNSLLKDRNSFCSGGLKSDWDTVCNQALPFEVKRLCERTTETGVLKLKGPYDNLCKTLEDKPLYPTGFDPSNPRSLFPSDTGIVIAPYDCATANFGTAAVGFLTLDPEGSAGAMDVNYPAWLATDSQGNPAGVFDKALQFTASGDDFLLQNGSGAFRIWKAVDLVNQSTPIIKYSCQIKAEFDCNNDGSIQDPGEKNVPMLIAERDTDYAITVPGNDGVNDFSVQFKVKVRRLDTGTTPAGTCPIIDRCYPTITECEDFKNTLLKARK